MLLEALTNAKIPFDWISIFPPTVIIVEAVVGATNLTSLVFELIIVKFPPIEVSAPPSPAAADCPVEFHVKFEKDCPRPLGTLFVNPTIEQVEPDDQVAVGIVPPFKLCS